MENLNIVYINLKHRTDRNEQILKEFERMNIPIENIHRIEASNRPKNGPLGCCESQVMAVTLAIENNWDKVLICEDDFVFTNDKETTNKLFNDFFDLKIKWDVFMFSSNLINYKETDHTFLRKVMEGKTASGYLLNNHYYQTLLNNFQECFNGLNVPKYDKKLKGFCVDMGWRKLQPTGNWFVTNPKLGKQKEGYSDIMKQYKKYDC